MPAGCDPLPKTPSLPVSLDVKSPTVEGVVQALDASLDDAHKAFLRCFPDEDDLIARVHSGFGRWLRTTLRLWTRTPLTAALNDMGIVTPDDMSTVIMLAYSRALKQAPLDVAGAVSRTRALREPSGGQ
jgi:hypothetical protein